MENNIGFTSIPLNISAQDLILDTQTEVTIAPGEVKVYRIEGVPPEETLSAILTTSEKVAYHNLFLQHKKPPTGFEFDAFSKKALSFNQTATVHSTRSGTYYLRIESSGSDGDPYEIEILVKIAKFEILEILPVAAAPLGNVTVQFIGTVFGYYVQAELVYETYGSYPALNLYWFNSENVYATFDSSALPNGVYSARLSDQRSGLFYQLNNSFSISEGIPGQLSIRVTQPQRLVFNTTGRVTVYVQNIGNTDILVPFLTLQSRGNALFRQLNEDIPSEPVAEYSFISIPFSGPGGILPPEARTQIEFEVIPKDEFLGKESIEVTYIKNTSESHIYLNGKDALQPPDIPNHVWDIVWNNFLESVGTSWGSFSQRISEVATQFSLSRRKVFVVRDIVDFQLGIAYGLLTGKYVQYHPYRNMSCWLYSLMSKHTSMPNCLVVVIITFITENKYSREEVFLILIQMIPY